MLTINNKVGKCEYCGEEFFKNRIDKRFCSRDCKCRAKDKRLKRYNGIGPKFRTYRTFDRNRNFLTNIDKNFLKELLSKSCVYCGYPSTGLDRINNTLGHIIGNCVPCCKECNIGRMDNFSHDEMLIIGKAIKEVKDKRIKINGNS